VVFAGRKGKTLGDRVWCGGGSRYSKNQWGGVGLCQRKGKKHNGKPAEISGCPLEKKKQKEGSKKRGHFIKKGGWRGFRVNGGRTGNHWEGGLGKQKYFVGRGGGGKKSNKSEVGAKKDKEPT